MSQRTRVSGTKVSDHTFAFAFVQLVAADVGGTFAGTYKIRTSTERLEGDKLIDDSGATVGAYYMCNSQDPASSFTFALKTAGDPNSVVRALRTEISRLDPDLALFDIHSMAERIDLSLSSRRTSMLLANAFGGVALFLASLGIYAVLAYLVTQRTREIGIRVALGSTRTGILRLVLREGFKLVAMGFVLGIVGAAALQKAVASQIYGVRPFDPLILAGVMALLGGIALVACAVPARRAMSVDPVVALRYE